MAEATHLKVEQIRRLIARRFPRPDVEALVRPLRPEGGGAELVLKPEAAAGPDAAGDPRAGVVLKPLTPPARVAPLSPGRYETRFTIGAGTHGALRRLEELLGRRLSAGELDEALGRGLEAMAAALERRRYGATDRPRRPRQAATGRRIPNAVKRTVWQRDQGRCTFVAGNGRRCAARGKLEYDHIVPLARGGATSLDNLRLRCRAHNQYEAEQVFGAGFMHAKRERARRAAAARRERDAAARATAEARALARPGDGTPPGSVTEAAASAAASGSRLAAAATPEPPDVTPWLMRLGFRRQEALRAAAHCAELPAASLEARVRAALSYLAPPARVDRAPRSAETHP